MCLLRSVNSFARPSRSSLPINSIERSHNIYCPRNLFAFDLSLAVTQLREPLSDQKTRRAGRAAVQHGRFNSEDKAWHIHPTSPGLFLSMYLVPILWASMSSNVSSCNCTAACSSTRHSLRSKPGFCFGLPPLQNPKTRILRTALLTLCLIHFLVNL